MFLALAVGISAANAQDEMKSKKGEMILPESGDWALGIDATPVLNYMGNFLSSKGNTAPNWSYTNENPLTITGKYFADAKTAYRGMLRLGFGSTTMTGYQNDQTYTGTGVPPKVTDTRKVSAHNITIGGGLEMRRGKTRLQGYYGGMLYFMIGGSDTTNTYGNAMDKTHPNPPSTNWSNGTVGAGYRITENKAGSMFGLGLRGFIGAEYFIFPKIAVGAEFGWGIAMMNVGDGTVTVESLDANGNNQKISSKTGSTKYFGLDTDINHVQLMPTGMLTMTMHF